jgi:L-ascorbate metabolism protein UlaG (beta-lactamase superfamily)
MGRSDTSSGATSGHFDGLRFFNCAPRTADKTLLDGLLWLATRRRGPWPRAVPTGMLKPEARSDAPRISVVGHATVLIQACGLNLVTDPMWSERAGRIPFLAPKRVSQPAIAFDDLPRIHIVLLSHNHYDHLDIVTLRRLVDRDGPLILAPLGNAAFIAQAVPAARVETGDWWHSHRLAKGIEITLVPAQHWSMRHPWDRRMALWCGFMVRAGGELIYFAGDTGYGDGSLFQKIRQEFGRPDVALLPIGAYAPRWLMADNHVDPTKAVKVFEDLDARQGIGIHWGVFRLSDEGRNEPRDALARTLANQRINPQRFLAAEPGFVWAAAYERCGVVDPHAGLS